MKIGWIMAAIAIAACGRPGAKAGDASPAADESKCEPKALGLADAKPLAPWKMPAGCKYQGGHGVTLLIESAEHFQALFACDDAAGKTGGIDFEGSSLVFQETQLSPAGMGTSAVDDGAKVTLISRQRNPCPGEPPPMPIPYTIAYLVQGKAKRSMASTACTVDVSCR